MKRKVLLIILMVVCLAFAFTLYGCGSSGDTYSDDEYASEDNYEEETTTTEVQYVEEEMPENEHIFVNEFSSRPSKIVIENPTDIAYYMKFEDKDGKTVFSFFVRPQSTAPMLMGLGTYYLKYACGDKWYGEENLFGPDTHYAKDEEEWPFESGKYWTLTMKKQIGGNVSTESISEDEF